jgi:eukaryotic-like serine/threonine-protein kinase
MVGKTILQYHLTEKIGGDGMGVVWKALDTRLNRDVVLKFLPEALNADASHRERFLREARAASALNHPNIVTVYDINSVSGEIFIVMEYVRGRTLADILREGRRLFPAVAVDYARQLCNGLAAAHHAGIVHRDIKPSNLMVTASGTIKILDFGLAKSAGPQTTTAASALGDVPLTVAGVVLGTIPYMSPEQVSGGEIDQRSDVFSIGVVLYEMLSGVRPFHGSSNSEVMRAVLSIDPPPLRTVCEGVSEALSEIVERCLQKNVQARYRDAGEVVMHLSALDRDSLPHGPIDISTVAATAETLPRVSKPKSRSRLIAAGLFVLVLVGATG